MTVTQRVAGVLTLNPQVFEEIEADHTANRQALLVVVLASVATGLGGGHRSGMGMMALESVGAVVGWITWAAVTYVLGGRIFREAGTRTDMGELLRVMGYSSAPSFFSILGNVPFLGRPVPSVIAFWLLATTVIAVRQALDYRSTLRAFFVVVIGWLLFVAIRDLGIPWVFAVLTSN